MSGIEIAFPVTYRSDPILIGIHAGTDSSVNIVTNGARSPHQNVLSFLTNYTQSVYVLWLAVGY